VQGDTRHSRGDKTVFSPDLSTIITKLKTGSQPGCLMDRQIVVKSGMVDENLHYIMDVDVLLRVAFEKPPVYIPFPVVYLRIHPDIKSLQWNTQRAKERIIVANKIFNRPDLPDSIKKLKGQSLATAHQFAWRGYIGAKMYVTALWHLLLDILHSPHRGWRQRLEVYKLLKLGPKEAQFVQKNQPHYSKKAE
jgi:hypothetical protein